ncbi:DUF1450 domain-containing protein [Paenibacillus piri]|uniref:DUF1450 domain-containing protein n=1 Tax=Paenibacillus piri TaxID=2547395 RepID=A0A4R5KR23_9BACL|nr:DUF1450 domain-containing protein [Paenibacillus piri]TDF97220.1 DUF1450 domain-containing protein [Paenibacillus piri]
MDIKMCCTNLDLFAGESAGKAAAGIIAGQCAPATAGSHGVNKEKADLEVEEVRCLGYCYWCPQGLMALVDGILVRDNDNHGE